MAHKKLYLMIGGPQGSGIETTAFVLTTSLARQGYGVLSNREYHSNIVGRHSYIQLTVSNKGIPRSHSFPVDFIGSIDAETVFTHFDDIDKGGYLLYDSDLINTRLIMIRSIEATTMEEIRRKLKDLGVEEKLESLLKYLEEKGVKLIGLSYKAILDELKNKYGLSLGETQRFKSSIPVGVLAALMNISKEDIEYALRRRFAGREKLIERNLFLIERIMKEVKERYGSPLQLEKPENSYNEFLIASGNDTVGMGKAVGGGRFQSYYPITPAADESFFLERYETLTADGESKGSVLVFQTEDELAAINAAIGAALAGVRSSTTTSGPGFSLMVEGIGWAGMNETPVVVTYYMRGGPSTGLPTRGSQSDLLFTLFAGHGEFPRIVIASGDHNEAFYDAILAFNYAEKYQTPVIHLLDKFLANSIITLPVPDFNNIRIERGKLMFEAPKGEFKRFDLKEPISPRPIFGSGAITWYTGDEHDEEGHIDENPEMRDKMYEKRMKKLEIAHREIPQEERAVLYGKENADFLVVGWGSVKGVALDVLEDLEKEGITGAYLHLRIFSPFPTERVLDLLNKFPKERIIAVEHNILAQASQITAMNTGYKIQNKILKYNGRPMYRMELFEAIKQILDGKTKEVVLRYGK